MALTLKDEERDRFASGLSMMAFTSLVFFIVVILISTLFMPRNREVATFVWVAIPVISLILQTIGYNKAQEAVQYTPIAGAIKTLKVMTILNYIIFEILVICIVTADLSTARIFYILWAVSLLVSFILGITTTNKIRECSNCGGTGLMRSGYIIQLICLIAIIILQLVSVSESSKYRGLYGYGASSIATMTDLVCLAIILMIIGQILVCFGNILMAFMPKEVEIYADDDDFSDYSSDVNTPASEPQSHSSTINLDKPTKDEIIEEEEELEDLMNR